MRGAVLETKKSVHKKQSHHQNSSRNGRSGKQRTISGNRNAKRRRKSNRNKLRNKRIAVIVVGILMIIAIIFGAYRFHMYRYVNKFEENVAVDGLYIGQQSMAGMSKSQLQEVIDALVLERQADTVTLITTEPEETENVVEMATFALTDANGDKVIADILSYGKEGKLSEKYKMLKALEDEKKVYEVTYKIDKALVQQYVDDNYAGMIREPVNSVLSFDGGSISASEDQNGMKIDIEKTVKMIEEVISPDWKGIGETIEVPILEIEADVQQEILAEVQDHLGSFTTYCGGKGTGRYQNVQRAAELMNGQLLMPGEEMSVNAVISPYTEENGYANGGTFVDGEVVDSLGGGICQVSSTTYNAVLYAELEVVKRAAHSMTVSYVKPAKDAAIAGDYKDFVFKNNTSAPVYIYAALSGTDLKVALYGKETRPENRTIEFESDVIERSGYGDPKFEENAELELGTIKQTFSGYEGMIAELWKVVYIDGVEESREIVNKSTYRSSSKIYDVGTQSDSSAASEKVKGAIGSQDQGTIDAAISEANGIVQAEKDKAAAEQAAAEQAAADKAAADKAAQEQTGAE